jgi:type VI secretion system protein ImpA
MILLEDVPKLVDELLQPIEGDNPSGQDLRYDPVYDAIREARREDDDLNQGAWQTERKVADLPKTISLSTGALKKRTKDLQIAAWLTDALLRKEGFSGLAMGLKLCHGLLDKFWDTLYPPIEEDDLDLRAAPLAIKLDIPVRQSPLNREGHNWFLYTESRKVGYEDQAKDANQKKARDLAITKEKKLAPEIFDKSFRETPKVFYVGLEKSLDECIVSLKVLTTFCDEKFGDSSPSFGKLSTALTEVRHVAHTLLDKKRETEPDPVEEAPSLPEPAAAEPGQEPGETDQALAVANESRPQAGFSFSVSSSESPARRDLVGKVATVAAALRQREPNNPAPYLMMRGLRWGDLRTAAWQSDPAMLEAPPTEIRQHIKRLALDEKWKELLDAAEAVMALPCSRAWLDLQRFVVEACIALGRNYDPIAVAIRSELRCLLRDVPQLLEATLMDDTPAANNETRKWLREILKEPADGSSPAPESEASDSDSSPRWQRKFVDSQILAKEALRLGQPDKAIDIMSQELSRQRSARGRFQRRVQFVELCVAAGKDAIVQPMLEDLIATIDTHKLEEWEDKTVVASALVTIVRASKKIQADAKEKQKYFERICRLDPVQALNF